MTSRSAVPVRKLLKRCQRNLFLMIGGDNLSPRRKNFRKGIAVFDDLCYNGFIEYGCLEQRFGGNENDKAVELQRRNIC